jgi:hypothetical protein
MVRALSITALPLLYLLLYPLLCLISHGLRAAYLEFIRLSPSMQRETPADFHAGLHAMHRF